MKTIHLACVICVFAVQQCLAQNTQSKATFCEDGGPDTFAIRPDTLPKAVIDAVMNTSEGKQARADADARGTELHPEQALRAASIRLSRDDAAVFLVMGSSFPLAAADASWFWVVREDRTAGSVLLWMAGNCVELKPSSTHGYRDIEVQWASAGSERTDIYHYDGNAYRLAHSKVRNRKPSD